MSLYAVQPYTTCRRMVRACVQSSCQAASSTDSRQIFLIAVSSCHVNVTADRWSHVREEFIVMQNILQSLALNLVTGECVRLCYSLHSYSMRVFSH